MTSLVWCTDIHLNFLNSKESKFSSIENFGSFLRNEVNNDNAILVISGDISESPNLKNHLLALYNGWGKKIYFVLGNHDYYKASFEETENLVREFVLNNSDFIWLNDNPIDLGSIILCGNGSWYDGKSGKINHNNRLNDFYLIKDLKSLYYDNLSQTIADKAQACTLQAKKVLDEACKFKKDIFFITHVSPFPDISSYKRYDSFPYSSNISMGNMLVDLANDNPEIKFTVLSGHNHTYGNVNICDNLCAKIGKANYYAPDIAEIFLI